MTELRQHHRKVILLLLAVGVFALLFAAGSCSYRSRCDVPKLRDNGLLLPLPR